MAKFFSPDSKLYRGMEKLTDVVTLSLLWLLTSLPVITLGVSTIAAFTVSLKMAEDMEGHIAQQYFAAFKANIKQGIPMSFITILCAWALYLDYQIWSIAEENGVIFLIVGLIAAYVFVFSLLYVYPLLARYENTIAASLKNSFRISMKYFIRSVCLLLIVALELVLIFWNSMSIFIGVLAGSGTIFLTVSGFAMRIFRDIEKNPESTRESGKS